MRVLPAVFLTFLPFLLFAQKAEEAIQKLYQKYPQEKVILLYSKNEYVAGETIFFKAHVLTGYEPTYISTNLYTELYDKNKKLLDKKIIPLFGGSGDGSFTLPPSQAEDVYYVRAYTQWMVNFPELFQYLEPIRIYNPASQNSLRPKPVQWALKTAAEGGQLIAGEPTSLSVRLISVNPLPSSWSGHLREKGASQPVADVTVFNREIGMVRFVPEPGKTYTVVVKDAAGNVREQDLPPASETGTALRISLSPNKLHYTIHFKGQSTKGAGHKIFGTINDQPVFKADIQQSDGLVSGVIRTDSFSQGVLRLTLFNEKETPVAERLCFLHQASLVAKQPEIFTDTLSLSPKDRNSWRLEVDTASWSTYTVQVSDAGEQVEDQFLSSVYLRSDFFAPIHEADWYLQNVDSIKQEALDALLITEQWERFRWADLLKNNFPVIEFKPDAYLTYSGTVYAGRKLKPLRDVNLILQAKDSSVHFLQVTTDSSATFILANMIFSDTVKVFHQPNKRKFFEPDVKIDFVMENRFHPFRRSLPPSPWTVGLRTTDSIPGMVKKAVAQRGLQILLNEKTKMMEEVVVRTRAKTPKQELDAKLSSGLFSSGDATIFDFVNEDQTSAMGYQNILDWMQGRVAGYQAGRNGSGDVVPMIRGQVAQIFLDEMPVDPGTLNSISTNDIAMIKVLRTSVAARGGGSAIAIYTRRGDMGSRNSSTLLTNVLAGYQLSPPFFSPDYSEPVNQSVTDTRPILYRSTAPRPVAGEYTAPVVFYNNDSATSFQVIVSGFTKNGRPVYLKQLISR